MLTYQYTGTPLDTKNWNPVFGAPPTRVTATIQVASPFPQDANFVGGWVGGIASRNLTGIVSASISDGVRTFTPDVVFLSGYGTTIRQWLIGGGFPLDMASSDAREIAIANIDARRQTLIGDFALFQLLNSGKVIKTAVKASMLGQWTHS